MPVADPSVELTGVKSVGAGGSVEDGLADCNPAAVSSIFDSKRLTYIFANDLLQSARQILPMEHLHILLDMARFRRWEGHDHFKELLAIRLSLGNRQGSKALQISANPVLFLYREARVDQLLQQVDCINASDKALLFLFPVDAANAYAVLRSFIQGNRRKGRRYGAA